jgi:hypothetical protein
MTPMSQPTTMSARGPLRRFRQLPPGRRAAWLIGAIVALGTIVRIPQLFHSLAEAYSFRQTQTAFTVREYAEHGINLLTTPLPVFGPDSSVPMEFPLFQGIASLFASAGMPADMASRTLGLISFQAAAVLLALLLLRWHGRTVAVVGVALFEFLPYGLLWGASSLIDFMSVALSLLMVLGLERWFNRGSVWWLVAGSVGAIAGFLVKVTTVPSWGFLVLVSAILVIRRFGWAKSWRRLVVGLLVGPGVGFAAAIAWTLYADRVKLGLELTSYLTSSNLRSWNFGTLLQRLDPETYRLILDRIAQEIAGFGLIGLLVALAAVIFQRRVDDRITTLGWLAVAVSGPLVFVNLYYVHSYYLIAIYPAIVAAIAIGGVWLLRLLPVQRWQQRAVAAVAVLLLLVSTAGSPLGRDDVMQWATNAATPALSNFLLAETQPDDLIILTGCNWDPSFLFYAHRDGVMFWIGDPQTFWADHDIADYQWLYSCDGLVEADAYLPAGWGLDRQENGQFYRVVQD